LSQKKANSFVAIGIGVGQLAETNWHTASFGYSAICRIICKNKEYRIKEIVYITRQRHVHALVNISDIHIKAVCLARGISTVRVFVRGSSTQVRH
jgi:hypothetical protein